MRPLRQLMWVPLVAAALLAIYLPGLGNPPVFDDAYLADGELFAHYQALQLRTRMLSYGSFVWLQAIFGEGWWKHRLVNLGIHMAVVVSLWAFYREMLRHIAPPAGESAQAAPTPYHESPALGLAIAVFALNPAAVYAVAYLIQRSILLATLFVVLGLWLFARGLRTRTHWMLAAAVACYVLAVASKEHAILAPLAALPVYILVMRPSRRRLAIVAGSGALLIAAVGGLLAVRYGNILGKPFDEYSRAYLVQLAALDKDAPARAWSLSIVNQSWLFFEYGVRWFLPLAEWMSISMRPPFPVKWMSFPQVLGVIGYLAVLVGGFVLLLRTRDWRALVGLSLTIPALLFATEFATVWVQDPFVLYRSYLWAIGVPGLVFVVAHGPSGRVVLAAGLVAGLLLGWQAVDRVFSMSTVESAWSDAIAKLPRDPRAVGRWFPYLNRGSHYADRDQFELAIRDFESSSALGDLGMGTFNIGSLLVASGKPQHALKVFDSAEKQGYDLYNLPFQRGLALAAMGNQAEAHAQFLQAFARRPPSPTREIVLLQIGRGALQMGRGDEAIWSLEQVLIAQPANIEGRYLLAMAHIAKSQHARALEVLEKTTAAAGPIHYARALAYHGLNRKPDAVREIDTAIRIGPDNPTLRQWQAKIKAMP